MSAQTCEDAQAQAALEELRNWRNSLEDIEPWVNPDKELKDILSNLGCQYVKPDIATYFALCDRVAPLIDTGLYTRENCNKLVQVLNLAFDIYESIIGAALYIERERDPSGGHPTDSDMRTYFYNLIDRCLECPDLYNVSSKLQRLKSDIAESEEEDEVRLITHPDLIEAMDAYYKERHARLFGTKEETDAPSAQLDGVEHGSSSPSASRENSPSCPATPAKPIPRFYTVVDTKRIRAKPKRGLKEWQSFDVVSTSGSQDPCVALSRSKSFSAILPPNPQYRALNPLEMLFEVEETEAELSSEPLVFSFPSQSLYPSTPPYPF